MISASQNKLEDLPHLNFPEAKFKFRTINNKLHVLDSIRKKYLLLTPEEWVRQNLIQYLINQKKTPASLIAIEAGITVNSLKKRCDVVIYGKNAKPLILAECKSPDVKITQKVFDQASVYNLKLEVPYLLISNGMQHYFCKIDILKKEFGFIDVIPEYGIL